tara:strand:- start:912 stop:1967 length:1056 start_codon:yes stop_codon:yes gene_type:complete
MKQILPLFFFLMLCSTGKGQYQFKGQLAESGANKPIYLSLIEDYRKLSHINLEQIIGKTTSDSLGNFNFEGDNLSLNNGIYRIHIDNCTDHDVETGHFFGSCNDTKSIRFIANNRDTVSFPATFANEPFCDITSTNKATATLLNIDALKAEMAYDFGNFRSDASRKLNLKKWFGTLQKYADGVSEPLVELYVYDFLSDRGNETYAYYLQDLIDNDYYDQLLERLHIRYPNARFTQQYEAEIIMDRQLGSFEHPRLANWTWVLGLLLGLSIVINLYLLKRQKTLAQRQKNSSLEKLTGQEQKIIAQILENKTNKEIASTLFISLSTVKTHINNLYKKLEVSTREGIKQHFSP